MPTSIRSRAKLPKAAQVKIFRRDGWLCYWCKRPVVFAPAMKYLHVEVQDSGLRSDTAYYHTHWTRSTAPLLDEMGAVLDHVDAFATGGACSEENLVTSCAKCNGRKSSRSIESWEKREKRAPIRTKYGEPTAWDGLSAVFRVLAERHCDKLNAEERHWLQALRQEPIT